jgi:5,10-methylene-tetrahydrofolate dehydrogenase/methenyl tetrahydrofolate cyclohydrolase
MILDGKKVSQYLDEFIQEKLSYFNLEKKYVVFLNFSNNLSSEVYIKMKQKKAKKFGLSTKVVFQPEISFEKSIKILELFNNDENCI